jgi:hypothetical protein
LSRADWQAPRGLDLQQRKTLAVPVYGKGCRSAAAAAGGVDQRGWRPRRGLRWAAVTE